MARSPNRSALWLMLLGAAGALGCDDSDDEDAPPGCQGTAVTAFVGVDVLRMSHEQLLRDQTVVIADGIICQVGQRAAVVLPDNATLIQAGGQLLMPGLADMHIHLQALSHEQDAVLYLAHGVTTVRNMWGFDWTLEQREDIRSGDAWGPEIFTTGPILDGDPPLWSGSEVLTTASEAAHSVERQKVQGYDFVKIYDRLSPEVYDEIIAAGEEHDMPVVGHVPEAVGLEHALQSGQSSIEHLTGYDVEGSDGTLEALTAELGVTNCPTLVVYDKYARVAELQTQSIDALRYVHPMLVDSWMVARPYEPHPFEAILATVGELDELGAPLLAGTDASNPFVIPGLSLHEELTLLVQAGLSPYEALRSATIDAARYLGTQDRTGTIERGKTADLLLLGANPLDDIAHTRRIEGVMLEGRWHPAADLQERLEAVAASYDSTYNLDFDCELPADYLSPVAADRAVFRVKGALADPDGGGDYVMREFEVVVDGQLLDVSAAGAMTVIDTFNMAEWVVVRAFSGTESLGEGHLRYNFLSAMVPRATLQSQKGTGEHWIDGSAGLLYFGPTEIKIAGTDELYRWCPAAVTDPASSASSFYVCHEPNEDFSLGEPLQLAGNIALSTDPSTMQATLGMSEPCLCWKNVSEPLSCAEFDAQ